MNQSGNVLTSFQPLQPQEAISISMNQEIQSDQSSAGQMLWRTNYLSKQIIPIRCVFNKKKPTYQLRQNLNVIPISFNTRPALLDISNMYTNIPIQETRLS